MTLATDEPILSVDFGTSNSAACWVEGGEITVIPLEADRPTIPSAIFFSGEDLSVIYGSEAIRRYEAGMDGRLMKALKTVLSSALIDESTAIRGGYIQYRRVLELFLQHIEVELHDGIDALVQLLDAGDIHLEQFRRGVLARLDGPRQFGRGVKMNVGHRDGYLSAFGRAEARFAFALQCLACQFQSSP